MLRGDNVGMHGSMVACTYVHQEFAFIVLVVSVCMYVRIVCNCVQHEAGVLTLLLEFSA